MKENDIKLTTSIDKVCNYLKPYIVGTMCRFINTDIGQLDRSLEPKYKALATAITNLIQKQCKNEEAILRGEAELQGKYTSSTFELKPNKGLCAGKSFYTLISIMNSELKPMKICRAAVEFSDSEVEVEVHKGRDLSTVKTFQIPKTDTKVEGWNGLSMTRDQLVADAVMRYIYNYINPEKSTDNSDSTETKSE
jgi:hypothetical protein